MVSLVLAWLRLLSVGLAWFLWVSPGFAWFLSVSRGVGCPAGAWGCGRACGRAGPSAPLPAVVGRVARAVGENGGEQPPAGRWHAADPAGNMSHHMVWKTPRIFPRKIRGSKHNVSDTIKVIKCCFKIPRVIK